MKKVFNNIYNLFSIEEDDFLIEYLCRYNWKKIGTYLIILSTIFSIICLYKNIIFFRIVSSTFSGIGIIGFVFYAALKGNKI